MTQVYFQGPVRVRPGQLPGPGARLGRGAGGGRGRGAT